MNETLDPQRLTRVEAEVQGIKADVSSIKLDLEKIADAVGKLSTAQGRPDWQVWGVGLAVLSIVVAVAVPVVGGAVAAGYWAIETLAAKIDAVEERSSLRHQETTERVNRVQSAAASDQRDERERNNRIERSLGRLEGIEESTRRREGGP